MHEQQTVFKNFVGKGEIARYEELIYPLPNIHNKQFLLFLKCFLLNQIIVSPFVYIFDISFFSAGLEELKLVYQVEG